jgi:hypothetical protein
MKLMPVAWIIKLLDFFIVTKKKSVIIILNSTIYKYIFFK